MSDKTVTVTIGSSISVSPDPVVLKKNQDKAKWVNANGTQFTIELPTGFDPPTCSEQNGQWVCISKTFSSTGKIKYNVTSPGKPDLDPEMDIQP